MSIGILSNIYVSCVSGFPTKQKDEVYLNLVLEYIPETVYKVARHYSKSKQTIPISFIKVSFIFNIIIVLFIIVIVIDFKLLLFTI